MAATEHAALSCRPRGTVLPPAGSRLTIRMVVQLAAGLSGMTPNDIVGPIRAQACRRPRLAAMWVARRLLPVSTPQIGRALGGRDHTTVLSALARAEALRRDDAAFRAFSDQLLAACSAVQESHHAG